MSASKFKFRIPNPLPHDAAVFGDRAFKEASKLKCGHQGGPIESGWCLSKKRIFRANRETRNRLPHRGQPGAGGASDRPAC